MSELIISVSGLRGIVGESLTEATAARYAFAFADTLPPGPIVITRDGRASGASLAHAIVDALHRLGRDTIDAGVAATPTTGVLVKSLNTVGGIQISASHNPAPYNGMKLFSSDARVIPAIQGQQVLDRFHREQSLSLGSNAPGKSIHCSDPIEQHLHCVLATVDVGRIRQRRFRVLLDSNHGAGSLLGGRLLETLGCDVTILGGEPDGRFEHTPEPTAENLQSVRARVTEISADIGFCQDPDADRLAIIDESARYVGEEYTLALCVDHVLESSKGPVVTNCSTSRMTEDLAAKHGVPFFRSAVGEANVVDQMLQHGAVLGGEGNGGVIDPRVVMVRDSFVGMALVLDSMASRNKKVSRLVDALPHYEIVKSKIDLPRDKIAQALDALANHYSDAAADRLDGLRLDWRDKWLLVRPSNTEPIVRAIAEARTAAEAQALCDQAAAILSGD